MRTPMRRAPYVESSDAIRYYKDKKEGEARVAAVGAAYISGAEGLEAETEEIRDKPEEWTSAR